MCGPQRLMCMNGWFVGSGVMRTYGFVGGGSAEVSYMLRAMPHDTVHFLLSMIKS